MKGFDRGTGAVSSLLMDRVGALVADLHDVSDYGALGNSIDMTEVQNTEQYMRSEQWPCLFQSLVPPSSSIIIKPQLPSPEIDENAFSSASRPFSLLLGLHACGSSQWRL